MSQGLKLNRTIEVFVSYAREDEELWKKLSKHLSSLEKRENKISVWHDRQIGAGTEWKNEIDAHLNTAHIILLLISADFLASDYCYDVEMKKAMELQEAGEARVIPIILRDCDFERSSFSKLNYLPMDGKPVTNPNYWHTLDEAFDYVAKGIRHAVDELIQSQIPTTPPATPQTDPAAQLAAEWTARLRNTQLSHAQNDYQSAYGGSTFFERRIVLRLFDSQFVRSSSTFARFSFAGLSSSSPNRSQLTGTWTILAVTGASRVRLQLTSTDGQQLVYVLGAGESDDSLLVDDTLWRLERMILSRREGPAPVSWRVQRPEI